MISIDLENTIAENLCMYWLACSGIATRFANVSLQVIMHGVSCWLKVLRQVCYICDMFPLQFLDGCIKFAKQVCGTLRYWVTELGQV